MVVRSERQEVERHVNDALRLLHHLALGNPECRPRDRHGEIIDLDAVELCNGYLDRVVERTENNLPAVQLAQHLVLKTAQRDVGLGEEVPTARRRVEIPPRREFVLKVEECLPACCLGFQCLCPCEFVAQSVEKERVDDLVDVLDARVVHPTRAPRYGVERGFKDRAEDGRADRAPVESRTCIIEQDIDDLLCELRDLDVFLCEQTSVDVGECGERIIQIRVALCNRGVEHTKELDECLTKVRERYVPQVVVEHGVPPKQSRILGIECEDEANAEDVEALLTVRITHVAVFLRERVIQSADELPRLDGDLHLLCNVFIVCIHEKVQTVRLAFEVLEQDLLRLCIRCFHVVDEELREV